MSSSHIPSLSISWNVGVSFSLYLFHENIMNMAQDEASRKKNVKKCPKNPFQRAILIKDHKAGSLLFVFFNLVTKQIYI